MNREEFNKFFKPYSKNVDNANTLSFWRLSDQLILETLKRHIPVDSSPDQVILDAGGGTGRWICDLSKIYQCKFVLYDLSEDMLAQARENIKKAGIETRVQILQGDMTHMGEVATKSIDYTISIYNPISFIDQVEKAACELYRTLKDGGKLLITGQGYYNALASKINNYLANPDELKDLEKEEQVKWGPDVPKLRVFSEESLGKLLQDAGFKVLASYGIPVFAQPGPEDFDSDNASKSRISQALESPAFFDEVLDLEVKHNSRSGIVNRGMNILVVGGK